MYILGIYDGHNATAALIKDGIVIGSVSEERFNGIKNYIGFPYKSIDWLLQKEHIKGGDIDIVAIPRLWGVPVYQDKKIQADSILSLISSIYKPLLKLRYYVGLLEYHFPVLHHLIWPLYSWSFRFFGKRTSDKMKQVISEYLSIPISRIRQYEHHMAHAAAAYYGSPFNKKKALVLTIDGEGDLLSATVNVVKDGRWKRLASTPSSCSLGYLYMEVTGFLGMKRNEHEYKVMGLAPYAKEYGVAPIYEKIKDIIVLDPANHLAFKERFDTHLIGFFLQKEMKEQRFDNIAGAFQKLVEDRLVEWVSAAIKETGIRTVCMAGGVVMNVKANMKVAELSQVREFFPCPSAGDESTAIGAAYLGYVEYGKELGIKVNPQPLEELYLGPEYTNKDIDTYIKKNSINKNFYVTYHSKIETIIAKLLKENKVVARMNGKMEWGARALGNRSILANPSNPENVRIINEQMKLRDFWMPFTPSILKDSADDYIINPKKISAPYMILTFNSTEKARKELKAAMHPYDFTIRPQLVDSAWNPSYFTIISEFKRLTGIAGVLNTSFNLHGLPIVLSPKEALYAFEHSGLEYLALGNYLISKKKLK